MFHAAKLIYLALSQEGGPEIFTEERGRTGDVWLQADLQNGGSYEIHFISCNDDNSVSVRVFGLITVREEQKEKLLPVLNELNLRYYFIKFAMTDDGEVNLEYDYLPGCPDPSASAPELVTRIIQIVDDAYPALISAICG